MKINKSWESLVTNESLEAIVAGLNPQQNDSVLAICGSGDQAFSLLEKADKITIVDSRDCQIQYFLKRKLLLEAGEFDRFLNLEQEPRDIKDMSDLKFRNKYFSAKRLERIKSKLKDSEIKTIFGDIFNLRFPKGEFNKVYLSNALSYGHLGSVCLEAIEERLRIISGELSEKSLTYISDSERVIGRAIVCDYAEDENSFLNPLGLRINPELTVNAQRLQDKAKYWNSFWKPAVLEKTIH